jgi:hypothetical protein
MASFVRCRPKGFPMPYEIDMAIFYDVVAKTTSVSFRGKVAYLPGPYLDRKAGIAAGEDRCRRLG